MKLKYNFEVQVRLNSEFDIQFECSISHLKYQSYLEFGNANLKVMLIFDNAAERRASDFEAKEPAILKKSGLYSRVVTNYE